MSLKRDGSTPLPEHGNHSLLEGAGMRSAIKPKHAKDNPKKESIHNPRETTTTDTPKGGERIMSFADVSLDERHQLIAQAAYFRAAQRSFAPGHELDDWLGAEAEINERVIQTRAGDLNKVI
jgi:hypothetical protein